MISFKWIFLGLIASLLVGLLFSEFISGIIIGSLITLLADSLYVGKKKMQKEELTDL